MLRHEFVNARGAIARFDRWALEIRLIDVQEQPAADLAIARLVTATVRALCEERWAPLAEQQAFTPDALRPLLFECIRDAERARVEDPALLRALGRSAPCEAGALWQALAAELLAGEDEAEFRAPLAVIFEEGTTGDGLYVVAEGEVEISASLDGGAHRPVSRLGPGEAFGEMAFIESKPRSATARAARSSTSETT